MKSRHGAVSTTLLTAAGLIGLGAAGLSAVTGVTPCSLMESCTTDAATPVAVTVCDTKETKGEVTLVSAKASGACETSCSDEATAVAVNASDCASACEGEAKAVAVNASSCETECSDAQGVTLVAVEANGDCGSACSDDAKAVAVNGSDCATGCDDKAAATTLVAGEGEDCCGECAEGTAGKTLPVAVHAFNTDCPYSGNAVKADAVSMYHGMKVAFCCNGCQSRFDKADEATQAKLVANVVKPINSTCCDKPVDVSTMSVINGFPVAECSDKCAEYVKNAPAEKQAAFVASLIKPINSECCGTPAAEAKMVGFHHGKAIALCGEKCAEHFNAASDEKKDAWVAKMVSQQAGACEGSCEDACDDASKAECGDDCDGACKADA